MQCTGCAVDGDCVGRSAIVGYGVLEFLNRWTLGEKVGAQHFNDGINISLRNVLATVGDHAQKLSNLSWLASTQACSAVELIQSGLLSLV